MDDKVLRFFYTLFVGIMLALFVGLGVQTFYPAPEEPHYPTQIAQPGTPPPPPDEQHFQDAQKSYQDASRTYNRNVSVIGTAAAVVMMAGALVLEKKNKVLANGTVLGGLLTLLYGVGHGLASSDTAATFLTVVVGLTLVVLLGYRRFARHHASPGAPPPGEHDAGPPPKDTPAGT